MCAGMFLMILPPKLAAIDAACSSAPSPDTLIVTERWIARDASRFSHSHAARTAPIAAVIPLSAPTMTPDVADTTPAIRNISAFTTGASAFSTGATSRIAAAIDANATLICMA